MHRRIDAASERCLTRIPEVGLVAPWFRVFGRVQRFDHDAGAVDDLALGADLFGVFAAPATRRVFTRWVFARCIFALHGFARDRFARRLFTHRFFGQRDDFG